MCSSGDSTFRHSYLKRLVGALNALNKPATSISGSEEEISGSTRNIKLAADVSLALTANRQAWSRALLNRISSDEKNRAALRKILGPKEFHAVIAQSARYKSWLILQSKLKYAHIHKNKTSHALRAAQTLSLYRCFYSKRFDPQTKSYASLFNKRKRKLQSLVPGGRSMETSCLLRETADYITSLVTQVDIMKSLVNYVNGDQNPD